MGSCVFHWCRSFFLLHHHDGLLFHYTALRVKQACSVASRSVVALHANSRTHTHTDTETSISRGQQQTRNVRTNTSSGNIFFFPSDRNDTSLVIFFFHLALMTPWRKSSSCRIRSRVFHHSVFCLILWWWLAIIDCDHQDPSSPSSRLCFCTFFRLHLYYKVTEAGA